MSRMPESESKAREKEAHDLTMTLTLFSISAGLLGVCLTAIGLIRVVITQSHVQTIADDLLAIDSVLFMLSCFLSFWSFKTGHAVARRILRLLVDWLFMIGLVLMVAVCFLIGYAII